MKQNIIFREIGLGEIFRNKGILFVNKLLIVSNKVSNFC
jgi:hypothetical protein